MTPTDTEIIPGEDCVLRHRKDAQRAPTRKRIIICCDGTWQSAVSGKKNVPSNVTRLCRSLNHTGTDEHGNQWQQVVWYDSGVGTSPGLVEDVVEGAFGEGVEQNVIEAYNFCVLNYHPGDEIMCFGFSRGAYTARTIAGLISDVGICHKSELNSFPDLWRQYKKVKKGKRFDRSDLWFDWMFGKADENQGAGTEGNREFRYEHAPQGDWAQEGSREVKVVGVFDTVGSIGMPQVLGFKLPSTGKDGWHNVGLSPNIRHAFQALALDEHRQSFTPSVWYLPNKACTREDVEARKKEEAEAEKRYSEVLQEAINLKKGGQATDAQVNAAAKTVNQVARAWNKVTRRRMKSEERFKTQSELKQVWFPGYHVNIGGGDMGTLDNVGDMEEMSNITYSWMLDQIKNHLSVDERFVIQAMKAREEYLQTLNKKYEHWEASVNTLKRDSFRQWVSNAIETIMHPTKMLDPPEYKGIRRYGWGEGILINSYSLFYHLNGKKWRTRDSTAQGMTMHIHPVVNYRVERMKTLHKQDSKQHSLYKPLAPNSEYKRWKELDDQGNVIHKYKFGNSSKAVPEWKLGVQDSYERLAIAGLPAYDYVDALDDELNSGFRTERFDFDSYCKTEYGLKPSIIKKLRDSDTQASHDENEGWGAQSQSTVFDPIVQPEDSKAADSSKQPLADKSAPLEGLKQNDPQRLCLSTVH
ncbi:hypothetical protein N7509_009621 [Penicillium cosmopolitanum]|uniref:T6SS Phospholipase effector Tle1-like catalytic domain-containing protein n=1 Tax=Penicillium cosmopolitanum TaxID=1131564 RepID=A0A9X0B3U7_9EURO|nr:uncharacterized protein N7509_009621 [Penicillium cosmopolitanum]KAJ5387080.1 hypothetical protein N7509_009621 [Penicillium cosmopolitanum]